MNTTNISDGLRRYEVGYSTLHYKSTNPECKMNLNFPHFLALCEPADIPVFDHSHRLWHKANLHSFWQQT